MEGSFTDSQVHLWLQEIADDGWVSLHYDIPALGGVGYCEVDGGGYTRQKPVFSQPANRAIWSLADIRFSGLKQTQLTHFGVFSKKLNGRLMCYGRLPEKKVILNGKGFVIHEGDLAISIG